MAALLATGVATLFSQAILLSTNSFFSPNNFLFTFGGPCFVSQADVHYYALAGSSSVVQVR